MTEVKVKFTVADDPYPLTWDTVMSLYPPGELFQAQEGSYFLLVKNIQRMHLMDWQKILIGFGAYPVVISENSGYVKFKHINADCELVVTRR